MTVPDQQPTYWQSLASAADQGHLFLSPEAAEKCSRACDDYLDKLVKHKNKTAELANTDGWGDFDSGHALAEMFSKRAVGGPNSMAEVLQSHIDVVMAMQVVFKKFFADTTEADATSAADIGRNGPR